MPVVVKDFELMWIREIERRIDENLPVDYRQMMVDLANDLPAGFTPDDVNRGLAGRSGATLLGIQTIGDSRGIISDVERALVFIRDRLFADPHLSQVLADDVASALDIKIAAWGGSSLEESPRSVAAPVVDVPVQPQDLLDNAEVRV